MFECERVSSGGAEKNSASAVQGGGVSKVGLGVAAMVMVSAVFGTLL